MQGSVVTSILYIDIDAIVLCEYLHYIRVVVVACYMKSGPSKHITGPPVDRSSSSQQPLHLVHTTITRSIIELLTQIMTTVYCGRR